MPFYSFRLDVPAEISVVGARLHAAISDRRDLWLDGSNRVFYGRLENTTFRIRRNLGIRGNSFQPRIRGRLSPNGFATTMQVAMSMHPAVLVFMLIWGGSLAYIALRLLAQHPAGVLPVLGILAIGVGGSAGSFYWEARKAQTLLSRIATGEDRRGSIRSQQSFSTDIASTSVQRRRLRRVLWAVAALTLGSDAVLVLYWHRQVTNCPAFQNSLAIVAHSSTAENILGNNIKVAGFARGFVQDEKQFGYASLAIPVQGSSGTGMLYAVANRVKGEWRLNRLALWPDPNRERIDLTPPVRRETFSYPATGTVYLLPFDQQSAVQVRDLPAYYAARLGLQTVVLSVASLPEKTIDPRTQQAIAERAIDFMEERARQLPMAMDAVMVGVTSRDLRIQSSFRPYTTNYRTNQLAIVSTARLHESPLLAGANPELLAERVRKMVTKNVGLLRYPVSLSADPTSVLATTALTSADVDTMSEEFLGQQGVWKPMDGPAPCFSVTLGPNAQETWTAACTGTPPNDNRFETFNHYAETNSMVMSRTDFPYPADRRLSLVRSHWGKDDGSRTFGIGGNDSFGIYLVGDSHAFSWINLIQEDSNHLTFRRTSFGSEYANATLLADGQITNPFSRSNLKWNGHGWSLKTVDDWTYQFPDSGPGRSSQQSALTGILSPLAQITIRRNDGGAPMRIEGLPGGALSFESDGHNRVIQARDRSGRSIRYEYAAGGQLSALRDTQTGDERYEYDQAGRLTAVLDAKGKRQLAITYGYSGEITMETLGDGRTLRFQYRFSVDRVLLSLVLTDDRGFVTEWHNDGAGYWQSVPRQPASSR